MGILAGWKAVDGGWAFAVCATPQQKHHGDIMLDLCAAGKLQNPSLQDLWYTGSVNTVNMQSAVLNLTGFPFFAHQFILANALATGGPRAIALMFQPSEHNRIWASEMDKNEGTSDACNSLAYRHTPALQQSVLSRHSFHPPYPWSPAPSFCWPGSLMNLSPFFSKYYSI